MSRSPNVPAGSPATGASAPVITRAQNGVITARLSISNAPPAPVAPCPKAGAGAAKVLGGAATAVEWGKTALDLASPLVSAAVRARTAYQMARNFGQLSPLKAAATGAFRNLKADALATNLGGVGKGLLVDAGVGGVVGGLQSAARNVPLLAGKQITPANFAARVGYGAVQGAAKAGVNSAAWAGGGAAAGAVIGAGVGALFGGVGAVPGAVVGAKVGAFVGPLVGPLFDKAALGGRVESFTDSVVKKVLPDNYEAAAGRAADRAVGAVSNAAKAASGAVGGAVSGAVAGVSKGWGAASRFLRGG